jgi:hypothetical protein
MLIEGFLDQIALLAFGLCIDQYLCTVIVIGFKVTH